MYKTVAVIISMYYIIYMNNCDIGNIPNQYTLNIEVVKADRGLNGIAYKDWKTDTKDIVSALKSLSTKMWSIVLVLTISLGIGLLDRFEDPKENVVEKHFYHMPPETEWLYDGTQLFTVMDAELILSLR